MLIPIDFYNLNKITKYKKISFKKRKKVFLIKNINFNNYLCKI